MASKIGNLTMHDDIVLSQLFNPEATPSNISIDPKIPPDPYITDKETWDEVRAKEREIIHDVESVMHNSCPQTVKQQILAKALSDLQQLLESYPYAGLWNDLAQVIRLSHGDDILLFSPSRPLSRYTVSAGKTVMSALDTTIKMLTPQTLHFRMSPSQARTLSSALLQRGALFNVAYKHLLRDSDAKAIVQDLSGWKKEDFQEAASEAFFCAGRLGNELGRALAVHMNPTAKLCGQMVKDALQRELDPRLGGSQGP